MARKNVMAKMSNVMHMLRCVKISFDYSRCVRNQLWTLVSLDKNLYLYFYTKFLSMCVHARLTIRCNYPNLWKEMGAHLQVTSIREQID